MDEIDTFLDAWFALSQEDRRIVAEGIGNEIRPYAVPSSTLELAIKNFAVSRPA